MRVVFVTSVFDDVKTGPGIYAQYLWEAFREDPDLEFHLVAPTIRYPHPRLHEAGSESSSLAMYRALQGKAMQVAQARSGTIVHGNNAHTMSRFIGYPAPWIVQVNDYDAAGIARTWPGVWRRHNLRRVASLAWRHFEERRTVLRATSVVCNSAYTRERVLATYGPDPTAVRVIHKAVDTAAFVRPSPLPPDPVPGRPHGARLVFVGTNWHRKGLDLLLDAISAMSHPRLHLTVAGPTDGNKNSDLIDLVRSRGLSQRVTFAGLVNRAQLPALLWHSDVFVLPSRQEALGVAVLEALATGTPVVAASVGGIPEIITDEAVGVLVPPDDADALHEALAQLLDDVGRRSALRIAGPKRAHQFNTSIMVGKVKDLYLKTSKHHETAAS